MANLLRPKGGIESRSSSHWAAWNDRRGLPKKQKTARDALSVYTLPVSRAEWDARLPAEISGYISDSTVAATGQWPQRGH